MMKRAGREIRASRPALTTTPTLEGVRVMAAANHTPPGVTYKTVQDFPNFMVGDDGSVWKMTDAGWTKVVPHKCRSGYLHVSMRWGGVNRHISVHRLVLETFVGPCPPGMVCRHVPDFDPANNRLVNLCWGTQKENGQDRVRYGYRRHPRGHILDRRSDRRERPFWVIQEMMKRISSYNKRIIYDDERNEIRAQAVSGLAAYIIADDHELPLCQIKKILRGEPCNPDYKPTEG